MTRQGPEATGRNQARMEKRFHPEPTMAAATPWKHAAQLAVKAAIASAAPTPAFDHAWADNRWKQAAQQAVKATVASALPTLAFEPARAEKSA